jgi:hypothetical protein
MNDFLAYYEMIHEPLANWLEKCPPVPMAMPGGGGLGWANRFFLNPPVAYLTGSF